MGCRHSRLARCPCCCPPAERRWRVLFEGAFLRVLFGGAFGVLFGGRCLCTEAVGLGAGGTGSFPSESTSPMSIAVAPLGRSHGCPLRHRRRRRLRVPGAFSSSSVGEKEEHLGCVAIAHGVSSAAAQLSVLCYPDSEPHLALNLRPGSIVTSRLGGTLVARHMLSPADRREW